MELRFVPRDGADQPRRGPSLARFAILVVCWLVTRPIADLHTISSRFSGAALYRVVVEPERIPARFVSSGKNE